MEPPRTGQAAVDAGLARVGGVMQDGAGFCLKFTRQVFAVDGKYRDAVGAWNASPTQHAGDRHPPPAVPVWFDTASEHGHVAFHAGDGVIVSTFNEHIRRYDSLSIVEDKFNGGYMGWAEDINDVRVFDPAPAPLSVLRGEDKIVLLIQDKDHGSKGAFVLEDGSWDWVKSAADMDALEASTGHAAAVLSNETFRGFTALKFKRTND